MTTHPPSAEADYVNLRGALLTSGDDLTKNMDWPKVSYEAEWAEMVLTKGMGWDGPLDAQEAATQTRTPAPHTSIVDSTDIHHTRPLYEVVASKRDTWKQIGASPVVLDWITNGVYFPIQGTIPNFFHK